MHGKACGVVVAYHPNLNTNHVTTKQTQTQPEEAAAAAAGAGAVNLEESSLRVQESCAEAMAVVRSCKGEAACAQAAVGLTLCMGKLLCKEEVS